MSYYKQIDGVQYDRALVEAAEEAVAGRGDGRISRADAEKLLAYIIDGSKITAVEQATLIYLRDRFKWTDKADAWLKDAITKWEAGERQAPAPARAVNSEPAVVIRIGPGYRANKYFPAAAAAEAPGGAVIILAKHPGATDLSVVWEKTRPHKPHDLASEVETELVKGGSALVMANLWRFSRVLGVHNGKISWNSGFTHVPADTIVAVLKELGFQVIDAEDLL